MSKLRLFALSILLTTGCLLTLIYFNRSQRVDSRPPSLVPIADGVFITSQLTPENVSYLKTHGVSTLVDIRPDGEARDQAPSSAIASAARISGIDFFYIPVPHEDIPDSAVDALRAVLSHHATPAVLYCRSGRRAARTFALAEASQPGAPDCDALLGMVHAAGFTADDLRENINQRIATRYGKPTEKTDERGISSH